jgi:hypothetical protein
MSPVPARRKSRRRVGLGVWTCTLPKTIGAYVFVTDHYSLAGCESEIISSATVEGVEQITEFLKTSPLQSFPIKVLEPEK